MRILGISALYHDSAAALVVDGRIVAAAQEERFSRRKHDPRFPVSAIRYCLEAGNLRPANLDAVAFYDNPSLKFDRLLKAYLMNAPAGYSSFRRAAPHWPGKKFAQERVREHLREFDDKSHWEEKLLFCEHHQSHAASAFFPSPYDEAMVLTMDGVGEWTTTSVAHGKGCHLTILKEIHFPHSLGLLYSAFTDYVGFKVNSGEYKVMGLAPYGQPKYVQKIFDQLIELMPDGSFRLNMDYFNYTTGLTMTNVEFHRLFGMAPRQPSETLTQKHMDLAASIQAVLEQAVLRITRALFAETGVPNLCMAGGVALNCVANGKVLLDGRFRNLWIQPASGDAGGAVGAALAAHHLFHHRPRQSSCDGMQGSFLGPEFAQDDIARRLTSLGARFTTMSDRDIVLVSAGALAGGKALGWFQGRMEFGPRALGSRSILCDARSPTAQRTLNLKVKFRESFRPFAPSVLAERAGDYFDLATKSPYMLLTAHVKESRRRAMTEAEQGLFGIDKLNVCRSDIPAVTHVDYSARVHTVERETNPRFHALISAFAEMTGCAVLVNTSFNVRGEPIVCSPEDAFRCFMGTELDGLAIGNCFLHKQEQDQKLTRAYQGAFEPD